MEEEKQKQKIISSYEITLKPDASILITAKRRAGKTVISTNIIYSLTQKYYYQNIILFSDTFGIEDNGCFNNICNKKLVFKSEQLDDKIDIILKYLKKNKKKDVYNMIILDDMNLAKKSKGGLQKLMSQGRHYNLCIILIVQFPKILVDNIVRSNLDIIIVSKLNYTGLEAVYECLNTPINKKEFFQFVYENTKNHQFVMYNSFDDDDDLKIIKGELVSISLCKNILNNQ